VREGWRLESAQLSIEFRLHALPLSASGANRKLKLLELGQYALLVEGGLLSHTKSCDSETKPEACQVRRDSHERDGARLGQRRTAREHARDTRRSKDGTRGILE
jgi:hypothetical protein